MAEPISIQQLKDASLDVKSLEEVVNGDENVVVTTRLGETYPSVKGSIKRVFETGGLPATPFATKALMTASALTDGEYAQVTDDTVNNGLYVKTAGAWFKSDYDPVLQSKEYTDDITSSLEVNATQNPNKMTVEQVSFEQLPTNTEGITSVVYRNGIKQLKIMSATTGGNIIAQWDFDAALFSREFAASITIEGLTAGSNGYVGVHQLSSAGSLLATNYAQEDMSGAIDRKVFKVNESGVIANATTIRLIVVMQSTGIRELYISNLFIADGVNANFIAPSIDITATQEAVDNISSAFELTSTAKNRYNPALAVDASIVSFLDGTLEYSPTALAFGKQAVVAGNSYTFWIPNSSAFEFYPMMYLYSDGTYLGLEKSAGSSYELVAPNPPTSITYSDSNKTLRFTIPNGSNITHIQLMIKYLAHTLGEFNTLVNSMQLELGSAKTAFEPYNPTATVKLTLRPDALPTFLTPEQSGNTFTVLVDDEWAYIRTAFSDTLDMVQKIQYGTKATWSNNVINPYQIKTIPKATSKASVITAYDAGALIVEHDDDAAPIMYNGTYVGANHGAFVVHQITASAHGKSFADVGSKWSNGTRNYTIIRVVSSTILWLISDNTGTAAKWVYDKTSMSGNTLTHVSGATNTASIAVSGDTLTQLYSAVNNHKKTIVADGYKELSAGLHDVSYVEFLDSYDIMNVPAIVSYLQSRVGTATEQPFNVSSIAADMKVNIGYRYAINGSVTINTQLEKVSDINFEFAGLTQALPLNYSGKSLLQYVPKVKPIVVSGTTYALADVIDVTNTSDTINMLKADWLDATNPPDRMAQIVKTGSVKNYGHVVGYSLTRGVTKPSTRQSIDNAGFYNAPTKKMYPRALTGGLGKVTNTIAYRSLFNLTTLPQATVYTWYQDNDAVYVVLDIHQPVDALKLPLPDLFNNKSAEIVDASASVTLHSEIVSNGGILVSVTGGYGQATIKIN